MCSFIEIVGGEKARQIILSDDVYSCCNISLCSIGVSLIGFLGGVDRPAAHYPKAHRSLCLLGSVMALCGGGIGGRYVAVGIAAAAAMVIIAVAVMERNLIGCGMVGWLCRRMFGSCMP